MSGCVLRVSGSTEKVRRFIAESPWEPSSVYYRGDPGRPRSRGPVKTSGFNVLVSGAGGGSIVRQAQEAAKFIEDNADEFVRLVTFNFKSCSLDFGLYDLATEDRPWPSYRIPKKLVRQAGEYGLELSLSFYGPP